jgi:hypothetical protein
MICQPLWSCQAGKEANVPWFSVHVECRGDVPTDQTDDEFGDRLGDLVAALEPHHGVVTGGGEPTRWGARVSIDSATALTAMTEASVIILRKAADAFLPGWPVVRAEAVREDVLDEDMARSRPRAARA